ncbi:Reverse transcriptase (RNA-dependent DNA polymerase) [Fragilaria crotonensis]|nr:Reverse transcriptase (RNA-dependent DNA polymerase) [Fragilaria crotonensis]
MSSKGRFAKKGKGSKSQTKGSYSNAPAASKKQYVTDYNYYLGSSKQASDYETTTEFLINHIKKLYDYGNDIGSALEKLESIDTTAWKPSMQVSGETDEEIRAIENKQYEIEFKSDYDTYRKRMQVYENNLTKAYALLWERCAKAMKNKIEARSDYDKIKNNPILLLKAIKEHALNYQENRYSMSIVLDALRTLLGTKQKEGESLQDFTKRFRVARDVLKSHIGGPIILTKIVEAMEGYAEADDDKREKMHEQAFNQFLAFLYLDNADKAKYGSILTGLNTQQSLGNDQYPKSITESNNVLSNHKFDTMPNKSSGKKNNSTDGNKGKDKKDDDKDEDEVNLSFAQLEGKCYCCGKAGHKSPSCRDKGKPKEEWAINKAQSHAQTTASSDASSVTPPSINNTPPSSSSSSVTGWAGAHIELQFQQFDAHEMRDWILLDNQSSVSVFCNKELVQNIRRSNDGDMHLSTNGGVLVTTHKADLPQWGEVWFNESAITNIISYAEMADRYRITYDSGKEDAFIVHLSDDKAVRFTRLGNNLYVFKPPIKKQVQLLNTVEENKTFFTQRQFERAKRARDLYHALGTPSITDFKAMLRMNTIIGNPVTTEDIVMAEQIFGTDIGRIKGKTTRRKPAPVVSDYIEIPKELIATQRNVTLCMDAMKVNGLSFLTTVSRNIQYRTAQYVKHQTAEIYREVLGQVFRVYNAGGFQVTTIRCDNEFRPLIEPLADEFEVVMNFANAQEHVPEAERNNRVIKERVRATYHRLPYRQLTKTMVKMLVSESAKKLNFFPSKNGVSKFYSPRMMLHQRNLDYSRHCRYALGTYVQAHEEPKHSSTNAPRSLDCIYLRYKDNLQGGHELLHLPTNSIITRRNITSVPITPAIVSQVHTLAQAEDMPAGLKIENRTGQIFYDSAWIPGVDYDEEQFDDDLDDENFEHEEDQDDDPNDQLPEGQYDYDDGDDDDLLDYEDDAMSDDDDDDDGQDPHANNAGVAAEVIQGDQVQAAEEAETVVEEEEHPDSESTDDPESEAEEANPRTDPTEETENVRVTRSGRTSRPPTKLTLAQHHLHAQAHNVCEQYSIETARVIAVTMCHMAEMLFNPQGKTAYHFVQSYSLMRGLKKFGNKGREAAYKEMKQLHERVVFKPIKVAELTEQERQRAMESLIFSWKSGTQRRDIMTADIPNAFVQTDIDKKEIGERIIMKIRGPLVDMLLELSYETYAPYVVYEGSNKVLYVAMEKALYGMLQSSLLYYKKFRKDIESIGFVVNPYDPCVANRTVNGKQHTVTWHVDDLKSSHVDPKVNDEFLEWLKKKYASDKIGEVKAVRGHRHDYLAMVLDYSSPGVLKLDMTKYVKTMVEDFPLTLSGTGAFPWTNKLFIVDPKSKRLDEERASIFHTFVMKGMFLCKRARQDVQPGIAFLSTRTSEPTEQDWAKLVKLMLFLKATQNDVTTLEADDSQTIKWYVDASFAVHRDYKSHTGATMTLGKGVLSSVSTKQKVMSRSSTEAELVGLDDVISKILWSKLFIVAQGYNVKTTIIYRDNTSAMKLEENGKSSSGKRTRHFHIKYFYITDLIQRNEVTIEYCPTDAMIADYMTKPLVGAKFVHFRASIMRAT